MADRYKISIAALLIGCRIYASDEQRDDRELKRPVLERSESSRKRLKTNCFSPNAHQLARVMTDLLIHRHSLGCETVKLYSAQASIEQKYWDLVPGYLIWELETYDLTYTLKKRIMNLLEKDFTLLFDDDEMFRQVLALESTCCEEYIFDPTNIKDVFN